MKLFTYIVLFLQQVKSDLEAFFNIEKYNSEEYIFKKSLQNYLLKKNPELKALIKNLYKIENSNYYVEDINSDRLISIYTLKLKNLELNSKKKFEKFKNQIAERDGKDSEYYNYLNTLSHKELIEYFLEFENKTSLNFNSFLIDQDLKNYLMCSLADFEQIKFISNRLSVLTKKARFYKAKLIIFLQDRRILFRKLFRFLFKNLDDYHSISIIQNLQVLILNNRNNERKYITTN